MFRDMCDCFVFVVFVFFFFKQKTAYEMRISDWSSDVCSSDLEAGVAGIVMRAPLEFSDSIQGSRMTAPLHVEILAAGEGKRMKSSLPKVPQKIDRKSVV